jgi:hypothetical protein
MLLRLTLRAQPRSGNFKLRHYQFFLIRDLTAAFFVGLAVAGSLF